MSYALDTTHTSPNHGDAIVPRPARTAVIHWWGTPVGQDPSGIIAHLCSAASEVSAHEVVWPGHVAQILDHRLRSWANGNDWANNNTLTFECDPNHIDQTIDTLTERLADLVAAGDLAPDFELHGHRDYYNTACPGDYYPRLAEIRQRTTNPSTTQPQEETIMANLSDSQRDALLTDVHAIAYALTNGQTGVKTDGDTIAQLKAIAGVLGAVAYSSTDGQAGVKTDGDLIAQLKTVSGKLDALPSAIATAVQGATK